MYGTRGAADAATGTGTTGLSAALLLIADSRLPAGGHAHSGGAEEAVHVGAIAGPEDLARFLRGRLATTGLVAAALSAAACHLAAAVRDTAVRDTAVRDTAVRDTAVRDAAVRDAAVREQVEPRRESAGRDAIFRPSPADGASDAESRGRAPAVEPGSTRAAPPGDAPPVAPAGLWRELDTEADARTPSPAMRTASRTQGRLLVRSARRIWPSAMLDALAAALPEGAHHPVALGAVACAAGCTPRDAALAAAYNALTGPATAAVRLLGLDPVTVHRLLAGLSPELDGTATAAVAAMHDAQVDEMDLSPELTHHRTIRYDWAALPSWGAPALDLLAEGHLRREVRLFVS